MAELNQVVPAFIEMAHRIVWATATTVDTRGRPRARILHPIWQWDGKSITGWIATSPTPLKQKHLGKRPYMSINYWDPSHDVCTAECRAALILDDEPRKMVWELFKNAPAPVGYDPAMVRVWDHPLSEHFSVIRLDPWRLRVFPGTMMFEGVGEVLVWEDP